MKCISHTYCVNFHYHFSLYTKVSGKWVDMQIDELKTAWEFHHNIPTIMLFLSYNEKSTARSSALCRAQARATVFPTASNRARRARKQKTHRECQHHLLEVLVSRNPLFNGFDGVSGSAREVLFTNGLPPRHRGTLMPSPHTGYGARTLPRSR